MRAEVDWRGIREDMEHERYIHLRKTAKETGVLISEDAARKEASDHASESCRLAIRQLSEKRAA